MDLRNNGFVLFSALPYVQIILSVWRWYNRINLFSRFKFIAD